MILLEGAVILIIRNAIASDIPGIAKVKVDTWRTTYRGLLSDEILDNLDYEQQIIMLGELMFKDDRQVLFVAEEKNIVGFSFGGEERTGQYGFDCEIYAIYVLKEFQNKGIGKELFLKSLERLSAAGYKSVLVWVLENNPYRRFYELIGGEVVGRKLLDNTELYLAAYSWKDIKALLHEKTGGVRHEAHLIQRVRIPSGKV